MNSDNSVFKVRAKEFNKTISVPSSKSFANRALILAAQSREEVTISSLPLSHDVDKMLEIFKTIGLEISRDNDSVTIRNSFPECESSDGQSVTILPGDGGTTTRFIIGLIARGSKKYIIEPEGRMRTRPISGLVETLKDLGVQCNQSENQWLSITGPYKKNPDTLSIDASKTTQHATSLALSLIDTHVIPEGMDFSKSYWDMTVELISKFKNGNTKFEVPVDFSSLGYPLALAAVTGRVHVDNCRVIDKFQSDSIFLDLLRDFGAKVELSRTGLVVEKNAPFKSIDHDCSNCPDLVPTIAFICSFSDGESKLRNVKVLRYKESDRLEEVFKILNSFNIEHDYNEEKDVFSIIGKKESFSNEVIIETAEDHRMVMVSYLFLRAHSGGSVNHSGCVSKSFGNFFEVMED
jgi:3-phosphoshikimate 1-carboxyvinyltransferase